MKTSSNDDQRTQAMKTNVDLQARYETIYKRGEERHFSKFVAGQNVSEAEAAVLALGDWRGKSVLDIGCGTGSLVRKIRAAGATRVVGVDYSAEAMAWITAPKRSRSRAIEPTMTRFAMCARTFSPSTARHRSTWLLR